jgi:hypothetical protein
VRITTAWISTTIAIAAALASAPKSAAAETIYPWCAIYSERTVGATNCGFTTLAQCRETLSGLGGMCAQNPAYAAAPSQARPKRRGQQR